MNFGMPNGYLTLEIKKWPESTVYVAKWAGYVFCKPSVFVSALQIIQTQLLEGAGEQWTVRIGI